MILYGIKNCDAVKKACHWLDDNSIAYQFHDLRADGLQRETLSQWLRSVDWETLLNKRGTTWRKLDDPRKQHLDESIASELMLEHPTLIKRPVLINGQDCKVGFKDSDYAAYFGKQDV